MRRRRPDSSVSESVPPVRTSISGQCVIVASSSSSSNDEVGDVRWPGMAEQGVGGPVSDSRALKPYVTDLGSDSDPTSSDEDGSSESGFSDNEGSRFDSSASVTCDGVRKDPEHAVDSKAILAAGGVISSSVQQPPSVTQFGNIHLNKSSGIHIGNKTVYQGPVTIQQYVVKPTDEIQGKGQLSITDGSDTGTVVHIPGSHRRSGLELNSGSFRIGASAAAASKGSGLLWRHLLGRRPGPATMAAWIALGVGCMTLVAIVIAVVYIFSKRDHIPSAATPDSNFETDELNSYRSPAKQQSKKKKKKKESLVRGSIAIPRDEWGAAPPKEITPLKHPVEYVIISHTASEPCRNMAECAIRVRLIQIFHVDTRKWADIGYNFLVGGDGNAYEGRGWDRVGAHSKGYNSVGIGISFIGTFIDVLPPPAQIRACKSLIEEGINLGKISPDYKLIGHRQVSPTESPGQKLYEEIQGWEHWHPQV